MMADVRVLSASDSSCIIDIFRLLTRLAPQVIFSSVGSQNNSATCDEAADSPSPPIFRLFSSCFLFSMQRPTTLAGRNNNLHTHRGWENLPHSSHILQPVPAVRFSTVKYGKEFILCQPAIQASSQPQFTFRL